MQAVNARRNTGTAAQRLRQVGRPAMFAQEIAKRFVGQFLKILHLVARQQVERLPRFRVELHALARHRLRHPALRRAWERLDFLGARWADLARGAGSLPPDSAFTLSRSGSNYVLSRTDQFGTVTATYTTAPPNFTINALEISLEI